MTIIETDLELLECLLEARQITERQYVVFVKRQEGLTLQEIADYLFYSPMTVWRDLRKVDTALAVAREEQREGIAFAGITIEAGAEVKTVQDRTLQEAIYHLRHRLCESYRKKRGQGKARSGGT